MVGAVHEGPGFYGVNHSHGVETRETANSDAVIGAPEFP